MAAHSTFAGLRRLAARAGIKIGANDLPEEPTPSDDDDTTTDEASEDETSGDDASTEGDDENGGDDDESETSDDAGAGDDAGDDAGAGATTAQQPQRRSADFLAGQRYGSEQTAGRFAAVLASPIARANLEMATDLLASSNMTPRAIIEHCDRYKGESSAKRLLDTTTKPNLGVETGTGTNADAAQGARKSSVAAVNGRAQRAAKQAGTPIRPSRRAAAAGKSKEK